MQTYVTVLRSSTSWNLISNVCETRKFVMAILHGKQGLLCDKRNSTSNPYKTRQTPERLNFDTFYIYKNDIIFCYKTTCTNSIRRKRNQIDVILCLNRLYHAFLCPSSDILSMKVVLQKYYYNLQHDVHLNEFFITI